jgi:hypothetical protein
LELGQPRQLDGCLEYGNQSQAIKASFFGDSKAQEKVNKESEVGCRQTSAEASDNDGESKNIIEKLIKIVQPITNYFPSTVKYPKETMLHLQGEAGIAAKNDDTYLSYFSYTLTPFGKIDAEKARPNDVKPDPTAITVSPSFSGSAQALSSAYKGERQSYVREDWGQKNRDRLCCHRHKESDIELRDVYFLRC